MEGLVEPRGFLRPETGAEGEAVLAGVDHSAEAPERVE